MRWRKGSKIRLVSDENADGDTRALYNQIAQAFGVPQVSIFFPALAACPPFLPLMWNALRPTVESREFFHAAQRLRADAYTRVYNYFPVPDLCALMSDMQFSPGAREELTEVADLFHYRDPLLLLLFSLQTQAMESPAGNDGKATADPVHPVYDKAPLLIDESIAPAPIQKLYDEIRRTLAVPYINAEYQAFARWPQFLEVFWNLLRSMLQSPLYAEWEYGCRELAWSLARELPGPVELPAHQLLEAGLSEEDIGSISRLTQSFIQNLSGLVLSMCLAKIGLEGGNRRSVQAEAGPAKSEPKQRAERGDGKPEQVA
jgi:hypothetical protein